MSEKKGTNTERRKARIYLMVLNWNGRHECEVFQYIQINRNKYRYKRVYTYIHIFNTLH